MLEFLTQTAGDAAAAGQQGGGITGMLISLAPIALIFVVFYFMLIRPQKKKEKQTQAMINAIKIGDEILTIGGIHGKVVKIKDDKLTIDSSAEKSRLEISRWAVKDVTKYVEDTESDKPEKTEG